MARREALRPMLLGVAMALYQSPVLAEIAPPAYQLAARSADVPVEVLFALAKTESNARLQVGYLPWPWTLNVDKRSLRFDTRQEACAAAVQALRQHSAFKVDIGLTQQNWGHVGRHWFKHPCDALAPTANLQAAATQLRRYYDTTHDWIAAAGKYHRPAGGEPARKYRATIRKHLQQICSGQCQEWVTSR